MFYYNVSEKSKFLQSEKITITTQTYYLKATAKEIKENDANKAVYQIQKITRVSDWEDREKEKPTSTNTNYGQAQKTLVKRKGRDKLDD